MLPAEYPADKTDRPPPHDLYAERAVLGAVLIDDNCWPEIDGKLKAADFWDVHHRHMFTAMVKLKASGQVVDNITLANQLLQDGPIARIGDLTYLEQCQAAVPHIGDVAFHARIVTKMSILRRLSNIGHEIVKQANRPGMTVEHVRERLLAVQDILDDQAAAGERFKTYTAAQLAAGDFKVEYHIPGILARGIPTVICGSFKTLKTSIAADMHLSLCTGHPFLGKFNVTRPYRSAFLSGESGLAALQDTYKRIIHSKRWSLDQVENLILSPDIPRLADAMDLQRLKSFITSNQLEVLIIDPAYLALDLGNDAGNLFQVGRQLGPLAAVGQETGCTIILVHHNTKSSSRIYEPPELADMQWAGFAEFAGQWVLIGRREVYDADGDGQHKLWLNIGGRPGHSSLWALDVVEGRQDSDKGRRWEIAVRRAAQARAEAAEDAQESRNEAAERKTRQKFERDHSAVLKAFEAYPDGDTQTAIRAAAGLSGERFGPVWAEMLTTGNVVKAGKIRKENGREYDSFRLNGTNGTQRDNPAGPVGSTHSGTAPL